MSRKLISIVTPCYNEELNLRNHFDRVGRAIEPLRSKYDFEHIYSDNCSKDQTFLELEKLASEHPNVRGMRFNRNLGSTRSMMIGLAHAKGDAAILIQCDLQDPPELIPQFIAAWEEGYDVVYGRIAKREKESWLMQQGRKVYYRVVAGLSDYEIPQNAGDFRITSRRVLDALKQYGEQEIYLRGIVAHIGFKQKGILYERAPRAAGESKAPLWYLFGFALNGLLSSTVVPIRALTLAGMATAFIGFLLALYFALARLFLPAYVPHGITPLLVLITFLGGMQLLGMGVIGEYIRKIYIETLNRPKGFIADRINI